LLCLVGSHPISGWTDPFRESPKGQQHSPQSTPPHHLPLIDLASAPLRPPLPSILLPPIYRSRSHLQPAALRFQLALVHMHHAKLRATLRNPSMPSRPSGPTTDGAARSVGSGPVRRKTAATVDWLAPVPRGLRYDTELSMCDHVLLSDLRLHRYLRLPNAVRRASRKRDTHQTPVHQLGELGVPRPSRVVAGRRASPRPAPSWSVVNVLMWCTFLILLTSTSGCGSADPNATAFLQIPTSPR
jgi:hypothetical protein